MLSVWSQRESHVFGDKIEEVNGILKMWIYWSINVIYWSIKCYLYRSKPHLTKKGMALIARIITSVEQSIWCMSDSDGEFEDTTNSNGNELLGLADLEAFGLKHSEHIIFSHIIKI